MPDIDVKFYIDQLRRYLPLVRPVPVEAISALHRQRDFGGIVKRIRNTMNVNVHLVLHWTNEFRGYAPAWIRLPKEMPNYGTPEFKKIKVDMFIRRPFAESEPYDRFAMAVAHEFSHVVLESINHSLRDDEKAVDLTAMMLGFSHLYRRAAHTVDWIGPNQFEHRTLGYLSESELKEACRILLPRKLRAKYATLTALSRAGQRTLNALLLPATLLFVVLIVLSVCEAFDFVSDFLNGFASSHR